MANNLFRQIIELIKGKTTVSTSPLPASVGGPQISISPVQTQIDNGVSIELERVKSDVNTLKELVQNIPKQIVTGMDVYTLGENIVAVTEGKVITNDGYSTFNGTGTESIHNAKIYTKITVNTSSAGIFYIIAIGGVNKRITITKTPIETDLIVAKIVVTYPGSPVYDNSNGANNYIVSGKDLVFNNTYILDDDTKALIKDSMHEVFAENLTGKLKLSDGLQITNQQNSIQLDSYSMKMLSSGTKFAEFNKDSGYFNDINGQLLSQYTKDGATIGNIQVTKNSLKSLNFSSGNTGFIIKDDGNTEFNNVKVRGNITALSGNIGKWVVGRDRLTDNQDTAGMAPGVTTGGKQYPFYAGATYTTRASAPFRVTSSGVLYASRAVISGSITANNINAISGHIGGYTIGAHTLSGGNSILGSSGYMRLGTTSNII